MTACEQCWAEAWQRAQIRGGSQADHYQNILRENQADHMGRILTEWFNSPGADHDKWAGSAAPTGDVQQYADDFVDAGRYDELAGSATPTKEGT